MRGRARLGLALLVLALAGATAAVLLSVDVALDFAVLASLRIGPWGWGLSLAGGFLVLLVLVALLQGPAAPAWMRITATTLPVFCLLAGGAVWGILNFEEENRRELYQVQRRPAGSLAELVVKMPDRFGGRAVLHWLRVHAPGTKLVATGGTLARGGLSAHALAGVAHVEVQVVAWNPVTPLRVRLPVAEAAIERINPGVDEAEVWVETGPDRPPVLCAVRWAEGVLLVRATAIEGCRQR